MQEKPVSIANQAKFEAQVKRCEALAAALEIFDPWEIAKIWVKSEPRFKKKDGSTLAYGLVAKELDESGIAHWLHDNNYEITLERIKLILICLKRVLALEEYDLADV